MKKMMIIGMMMVGTLVNAEVTTEMVIAARSNSVEAILALLPQAEGQAQVDMIHNVAMTSGNRSNAVAFAESLGASAKVVSYARIVQAMALKDPRAITLATKAHFETYGGGQWSFVNAKYLTTAEAVAFYELVLKNVPLTDANKDKLAKIKGELLKLKGI
jgi:hypothetical protein